MRCLHLARRTGVALLRALLEVFTIEHEVIPVDIASLEDRHISLTLPFQICADGNTPSPSFLLLFSQFGAVPVDDAAFFRAKTTD